MSRIWTNCGQIVDKKWTKYGLNLDWTKICRCGLVLDIILNSQLVD